MMLPSAAPTDPAGDTNDCRHHRQQDALPHFHVGGVWLMCFPARRCRDCGYEVCQAGRQCPGPEHIRSKHTWVCQRCGHQWRAPAWVRGPRDRLLDRTPVQKHPEPPLRCPVCGESRSLRHDRQCRPHSVPKADRNLSALRRTKARRPGRRQPGNLSAWTRNRRRRA